MFKKGDVVICIDSGSLKLLKVGDVFVLDQDSDEIWSYIKDENGNIKQWQTKRFILATELIKALS
jgi:uncharacterized cupin superfamily protein